MNSQIKVSLKANDGSVSLMNERRVEELFDMRYLHHLEFASWEQEQYIKQQCQKALKKGKIGRLALWLGKLHKEALETHTIPDVTIRWIDARIGYGVFSNRHFRAWDIIGEYSGLLRRRNIFTPNINDYCFMYPRAWLCLKAFTIDSQKHGNFTRFINHSDHPNCESVSVFHNGIFRILFRTLKPIRPGEELSYDYGDVYWHHRKKAPNRYS